MHSARWAARAREMRVSQGSRVSWRQTTACATGDRPRWASAPPPPAPSRHISASRGQARALSASTCQGRSLGARKKGIGVRLCSGGAGAGHLTSKPWQQRTCGAACHDGEHENGPLLAPARAGIGGAKGCALEDGTRCRVSRQSSFFSATSTSFLADNALKWRRERWT